MLRIHYSHYSHLRNRFALFVNPIKVEDQQLKAFLLDSGLISASELERAEKKAIKSKKKLEEILLQDKLIKDDELIKLKAYILGIPFVNLEKEVIDSKILRIIPEPIARKHNIIAFKKEGNELQVAMLDPEDLVTIDFIKKKALLKISPRLTSAESVKAALKQYQKSLEAEFGDIIRKESGEIKMVSEEEAPDSEGKDLKKKAEELPVVRIVDSLLKHAIIQSASDIHIEPLEKEVLVRYRIDGILHDAMTLPRHIHSGIVARIKVLASLKLDEHRLPQDGRFKVEGEDYRVSFRVSVLPVYDGEKVVMRLLPERSKGLTLEELGFRGEALEILHQNLRKPLGMILVTGPTGSGKTTTLYTAMDILNRPEVNISTVEDPIEYRMPHINQTQVKPQIGLTFANGLRSLVRQDPDIIMVGEIRDKETASLAINAALTGHLVLSTLHTNNAAGALPRLLEMGVDGFLVASTVNVIIAQRLVRKFCEDKKNYHLKKEELKELAKSIDLDLVLEKMKTGRVMPKDATWESINLFHPSVSEDCQDGYKGRIGIYEVLPVSERINELIVKNATANDIESQARKEGMVTMFEDGMIKAAQGITSIEEVLRVTSE